MSLGSDSYFEQDLELRFSQLTGGGGGPAGDETAAFKSRSNGAGEQRSIDYIQAQQHHQQQHHGQLQLGNMATTSHWRGDHHMPADLSAGNNASTSTGLCADYSLPSHSSTQMSFSGVFPPDATNMISAAAGSAAAAVNTVGGGAQLPKSICAVCGDRASGKHYGVYSCEGCKGFFKRTVRRELQYACRDTKNCVVDKRQRNRCQYCRYMKCLGLGMRREAVQEERQTAREKVDIKVESTTDASDNDNDMAVDLIIDAELAATGRSDSAGVLTEFADPTDDDENSAVLCDAVDRQLLTLVEWARRIPHFIELPLTDQVALLRSGWNELLIAAFAHQSTTTEDSITLARGLHVYRSNAHQAGIGVIFDRVLTELVSKMREMDMDIAELGCLRATVLFNPDAKGLSCPQYVEQLREKVYASLEEYCRHNHPEETGRFAKLLLRLPALRSIGLKCADPLFVYRLLGDAPVETFLMDLLDCHQQQTHQAAGQASRHKTSTSET